MAILRNDSLGILSQGLTRARHLWNDLLVQVLLLGVIALLAFSGWSYQWWETLDAVDQSYWWLWLKAHLAVWLGLPIIDIRYFSDGAWRVADAGSIVQWHSLNQYVSHLHDGFLELWTYPVLMGGTVWIALAWYLLSMGNSQIDYDIIDGAQLLSPKQFKKQLGKQAGSLMLADVPTVNNAELQNFLLAGDPGTGKSQLLSQMLLQIRERGDLAIVYDTKQDFVRDFYDPKTDVLLSPFDTRSQYWDIWADVKTRLDAETFAEAVIKESPKDPFWSNAARMLLVEGLSRGKRSNLSIKHTFNLLMTSSLSDLKSWLKGTAVAADLENEKTAASVITQLKTEARSLRYLPEVNGEGFSLRDWVDQQLNTGSSGWLFLPMPESVKAVASPIIAAQIELLATHILSKPTNLNRRIWFVIDELPSLPKMPVLTRLLQQGRGYGVASVLGIQNVSQLRATYGVDGANALLGLCSNMIGLRSSDPTTAGYICERLGKQLRREMSLNQSHSRGKSYNVSQGQSESIVERAVVSETTLMHLPDLQGVFSAKGFLHSVTIHVQYKQLIALNTPWLPVEMTLLGDDLLDVDSDNIDDDMDHVKTHQEWDI